MILASPSSLPPPHPPQGPLTFLLYSSECPSGYSLSVQPPSPTPSAQPFCPAPLPDLLILPQVPTETLLHWGGGTMVLSQRPWTRCSLFSKRLEREAVDAVSLPAWAFPDVPRRLSWFHSAGLGPGFGKNQANGCSYLKVTPTTTFTPK